MNGTFYLYMERMVLLKYTKIYKTLERYRSESNFVCEPSKYLNRTFNFLQLVINV